MPSSYHGFISLVLDKVLDSTPLAIALAAISLVFFYGLWFGLTLAVRAAAGQVPADPRVTRSHAACGG